ncbi:MAG: alanine--tRNA ligase [Acidobacteria bacterium]|nr:alanine--tRNA ligase [Acidobacteriota bacterium]
MTSNELRRYFLHYFERHGHRIVQSSSLVPEKDPTLLFTNAGMNQFKNVFLGLEKRAYKRAATAQKCFRASGKHNDLENVGPSLRHHTFFEMLGNFSFGDYFKKEAIPFAWDLVTKEWNLPPERLWITIYQEDEEAFQIWNKQVGVPADRIVRLGEKDNFWAMGDTGPCGPCSEIHFDHGRSPLPSHPQCFLTCECGRYVEIWNLVFMQFNRDEQGNTTPLPSPSIDTGMGLERITAVMQGTLSNYDTDLFKPLIREACNLALKEYGDTAEDDVSLRILADHARAATFLISDGVMPGNEGREYVLRKILRRAIRHGRKLRLQDPFLYRLTGVVVELMKEAYPEVVRSQEFVARVVLNEEEKFSSTLQYGLRVLDELCAGAQKAASAVLPGSELFKLYDTYGFPLDLAREVAEERKFSIDEEGFSRELAAQKERARASWKGAERAKIGDVYLELQEKARPRFVGYETLSSSESVVEAIIVDGQLVSSFGPGQKGEIILDVTPFYAESGGQVGDQGVLQGEAWMVRVEDTYSPLPGLISHRVTSQQGSLSVEVGQKVEAYVDAERRRSTMLNHTATHLVHAALREVLGEHVKQSGSLVAPDRLRFDFTHFAPMTDREVQRVEEMVNQQIRQDTQVQTAVSDLEKALESGALAFFGEKYSDRVRVVQIGPFSRELCGGTHVSAVGQIGAFKIVAESGIAAGIRRIEALTGETAIRRFQEDEALLEELVEKLKVSRRELPEHIDRLTSQLRESARRIDDLRLRLAQTEIRDLVQKAQEIRGIKVIAHRVDDLDRAGLRTLADRLKNQLQSGVVILGTLEDSKAALVIMVSKDLTSRVHAGKLIQELAPLIGGGGGGKPDLAEAGGKDSSKLEEALQQSYRVVEKFLS